MRQKKDCSSTQQQAKSQSHLSIFTDRKERCAPGGHVLHTAADTNAFICGECIHTHKNTLSHVQALHMQAYAHERSRHVFARILNTANTCERAHTRKHPSQESISMTYAQTPCQLSRYIFAPGAGCPTVCRSRYRNVRTWLTRDLRASISEFRILVYPRSLLS